MQAVSFYSAEMPITEKNIVKKGQKLRATFFIPVKCF